MMKSDPSQANTEANETQLLAHSMAIALIVKAIAKTNPAFSAEIKDLFTKHFEKMSETVTDENKQLLDNLQAEVACLLEVRIDGWLVV